MTHTWGSAVETTALPTNSGAPQKVFPALPSSPRQREFPENRQADRQTSAESCTSPRTSFCAPSCRFPCYPSRKIADPSPGPAARAAFAAPAPWDHPLCSNRKRDSKCKSASPRSRARTAKRPWPPVRAPHSAHPPISSTPLWNTPRRKQSAAPQTENCPELSRLNPESPPAANSQSLHSAPAPPSSADRESLPAEPLSPAGTSARCSPCTPPTSASTESRSSFRTWAPQPVAQIPSPTTSPRLPYKQRFAS